MTWFWLSSERMTVAVRTDDFTITHTPPIVRKFKGQSIWDLIGWMQKQPGFRQEIL